MKQSEKVPRILGFILLILAAFFFVAIITKFLGIIPQNTFVKALVSLGTILQEAYNTSCFLIPIFFFAAGICCFIIKWSERIGFILCSSFIPFLTIAGAERLCRSLSATESGPLLSIKIGSLVAICIMALIVEFVAAFTIGTKVEIWRKTRKSSHSFSFGNPSLDEVWLSSEDEETEDLDSVFINKDSPEKEDSMPKEQTSLIETDSFETDSTEAEESIVQEEVEIIPEELLESKEEAAFFADPFAEENTDAYGVYDQDLEFPPTDVTEETIIEARDSFAEENVPELPEETFVAEETDVTEEISLDEVATLRQQLYEEPVLRDDLPTETLVPDFPARNTESNNQENNGTEVLLDFGHNQDDFSSEINLEEDVFAMDDSAFELDFSESNFQDDLEEDESNEEEDSEKENQNSFPIQRAVPQRKKNAPYQVPSEGLLTSYPDGEYWVIDDETVAASGELKDTLSEFKIEAEVTGIRKGPVITMFEILPAPGVKLSKIVALQDNIALRLAASSVRIVAPIPGKHAVGIEVPNKERAIVSFKELIETDSPAFKKYAIPVVLGKDISGEAQIIDLAKTPHLLIAGSTGSGKSVCVNTMILSILYKRSPQDVKMILIDPKIVELKLYNDIPHLLVPVITEPKKAFQALQYCLCEMERRYALLDGMGVRDITNYNHRIKERNIATEKLPYIVVIIDEFADLMATTGKELESTVARLAAMSRAVGIHLVLATQRPSIDVITGLIKANIPTRIAFMVASKMDSRIIIDQVGAEKLLGRGDMLYAAATDPFPVRIQGTFVSDSEVENVVEYVKQYGEPEYIDEEMFMEEEDLDMGPSLFTEGDDPLYDQALEIVMQAGKASASYIQRRLKIGYNRAARLVEEMEARGIVGPANGSKPRDIIQMP